MSMHWAALLLHLPPGTSSAIDAGSLAVWALQFTPRVARLEEAVVLEAAQSIRLFGGELPLHEQVEQGARALGVAFTAWAPTSLAALALARAGVADGFARPLTQLLDPLPFAVLSAVNVHAATLARLGFRTLADVRRLPRGGIGRRFDAALLAALDQAYGLRPEVYDWVALPVTFAARLELPGRVETTAGLLFGARRLLLQLGGWLAARHAGVTAFTFRWRHDTLRAQSAGEGCELLIRTAEPTQSVERLGRLLAEHLAHVQLLAPALELELLATGVSPMAENNHSLLFDAARQGESLGQALERVEARLGKRRVLRPRLVADHRLEWMQRWQSLDTPVLGAGLSPAQAPQPTWMLRTPLRLATSQDRPLYQGPLLLLLGPERIEGGWWHRAEGKNGQESEEVAKDFNVQRDYWVALSAHAGVLWIFQQRLGREQTAWYLHGHFS